MTDRGLSHGPTIARPSMAGRSSRLAWVVAVLAVCQTMAGVGVALARGYAIGSTVPRTGSTSEASSLPGPGVVSTVTGGASAPVALEVPSVGIATSLVRLHVRADGTLETPGDFGVGGWWAEGPKPGDVGPAILVGHVDSYTGPAAFYPLRDVVPGDVARVIRADGSAVMFVVDGLRQFPKDRLPANEVYGPTDTSTLRLITCGGRFDRQRGQYADNVVVFAHRVVSDRPEEPGTAGP